MSWITKQPKDRVLLGISQMYDDWVEERAMQENMLLVFQSKFCPFDIVFNSLCTAFLLL